MPTLIDRVIERRLLGMFAGLIVGPPMLLYAFTGSWIVPAVYVVIFAGALIVSLRKKPPVSLSLAERQLENDSRPE